MLNFLKKHQKTVYWSAFGVLLIILVIIQYYGMVRFHYPDTPGDDTMNHWLYMQTIKEQGNSIWQLVRMGSYPPLYHLVILKLAKIMNYPEMTIMLWTYPAIIVLAALSAFVLAYTIFKDRVISLLTFFLYGFLALTPVQLLHDGGYPDLIAAHILLPLVLSFGIIAWRSNINLTKIFSTISALFLILLLMLTHHLSTYEFIGLVIAGTFVLLIGAWIKEKWPFRKAALYLSIYFIALIIFGYAFFNLDFFAPFRNLANAMLEFSNKFPYIKSLILPGESAIVPLRTYPRWIGWLVTIFGLLSIPLLPLIKKLRMSEYFYPVLILVSWAVILLVGSQLQIFSNPERLARDAALPLSVLAAAGIYYTNKFLLKNKLLFVVWIAICLLLGYFTFKVRVYNALHYEPMVRVTQADLTLIEELKTQKKGPVLFNTWIFYYRKYLPDWDLNYLPQLSDDEINLISEPDKIWPDKLGHRYQYFYIVDYMAGWAPGTRQDIATSYLNDPQFELLAEASSPINHVFLFKNLEY